MKTHIVSLILLLCYLPVVQAQTVLLPGDVVVVSVNASTQTFDIVPLVPIHSGTLIGVSSVFGSNSFPNEPELIAQILITEDVETGTPVTISASGGLHYDLEGEIKLNATGDRLFISQTYNDEQRYLFGVEWGDLKQQVLQKLPETISTINNTWVRLGLNPNHQYHLKNGASGTQAMIQKMVADPAHWKTSTSPIPPLGTSFRLLDAPVVVFNENISTVQEGDTITINVAIYGHDGSLLTVDLRLNTSYSTADSLDFPYSKVYTFNFSGLIGDAVYAIQLPVHDDALYEGRETLFFELDNLTSGYFGDFVSHVVFVADNDVPNLQISELMYTGDINTDFIEIRNNERLFVDLSGWKIAGKEFEFNIPAGTGLEALKSLRLYSPDRNKKIEDSPRWINGRKGEIVIYDINNKEIVRAAFDRDDSEFKKTTPGLEVEPLSIKPELAVESVKEITINTIAGNDLGLLGTENKVEQRRKGWFIQQMEEATDDNRQYFYWSEQRRSFRLFDPLNADSVSGNALFYYVDELIAPNLQSDSLAEIVEIPAGNPDWEITLTATDSDENGIINGDEGFNLITNRSNDSLQIGALLMYLETELEGDNFYDGAYLWPDNGSGWSQAKLLGLEDVVPPMRSFWLKADTLFTERTIRIDPNVLIDVYTNEALQMDTPLYSLTLLSEQGGIEADFSVKLFTTGAQLPKAKLLPQFSDAFAQIEENEFNFGGYYNLAWNSEIAVINPENAKLVIPLALSSTENGVATLTVKNWQFASGWKIQIEDALTNETQEINENWSFEIDMQSSQALSPTSVARKTLLTDEDNLRIVEDRYRLVLIPPGVEETIGEEPDVIDLYQNYPNPFNPATTISFYLPEAAEIKLSVFNVVGHPIAVLEEGTLQAGEHQYEWNAAGFPSGMYIYQLEAGTKIKTRKMTLVK